MSVVLLTNDDGVHAEGLAALGRAFAELGEVYIVAPEREQSACGHALTLHRPIRPVQLGERRFAVNGTPSDCVNLAVLGFLPAPPVLVVSGVNHGANLGDRHSPEEHRRAVAGAYRRDVGRVYPARGRWRHHARGAER